MPRTYHVGLVQRGNRAVFQFRRLVDLLDCEILEYYGERETSKAAARRRLMDTRAVVLARLQHDYPAQGFRSVGVEA